MKRNPPPRPPEVGSYPGGELELFARADNWKAYFARQLAPYISGRVLDVGAGIGSNINWLFNQSVREWIALEPDEKLGCAIKQRIAVGDLPDRCRLQSGTIQSLPRLRSFETILYLDVLEHIRDDHGELAYAADLLVPGGHLVVLAPAYQFLLSEFDRSIGHFRRYSRTALKQLTPSGCRVAKSWMLDSAGLILSLANRFVLHSTMPTASQLAFWNRVIVPVSRLTDRLTCYQLGRSIVIVWTRNR